MAARAAELTQQALLLAVWLSSPALVVSALAGLIVGVLASVTQLQDPSVTFVPRAVAVTAALVALGAWGGGTLLRYTHALFLALPALVQ